MGEEVKRKEGGGKRQTGGGKVGRKRKKPELPAPGGATLSGVGTLLTHWAPVVQPCYCADWEALGAW